MKETNQQLEQINTNLQLLTKAVQQLTQIILKVFGK